MPSALSKRLVLRRKRVKLTGSLNLFKLLLAALPTIAFGVFTVIFTLQQDTSARATREQDQRQADETNQRMIFKEYIDDMEELLLRDDFTTNVTKFILHMRVQTLTVLKHLNSARKHDIIRFLYENHLIRHDYLPTIELHGADLSGMQFIKSSTDSCDLRALYLPGIYAEQIVFDGCVLTGAVFDRALISGARFQSCSLMHSSFLQADLSKARLHHNQMFETNFTSALLTQSSIQGGISEGVDFTNADLYQSDIDDRQFDPMTHGGLVPNVFNNTRYPNGSFGSILTENLIVHSHAECHWNTTPHWREALSNNPLELVNKRQIFVPENMPTNETDCFFRIDQGTTVFQIVTLQMFSLLVGMEEAMLDFSALVGIANPRVEDAIVMMVHFGRDGGSFDYTLSVTKSIKNSSLNRPYNISHIIPAKTIFIYASFRCDVFNTKERFCFFDQAKLSIFKKTSRMVKQN